MKTMFKKTLLAVALAGVGASAQAATVAQVFTDYSKQYVAGQTASTALPASFTVALNAEYKNDDVVTFKFSSPLASGYTAPSSIIAAKDATGAALVLADAKAVITLGLLSQTSDTLTYRVTDVNKSFGNSTIGTFLVFNTAAAGASKANDVTFAASTLLSVANVSVTYSAKTATGNFDIDTGTDNTKKITAAADQFKAEVTQKIAGSITLPARTALTSQTHLTSTFTNTATLRNAVATAAGSTTYTLEGDFSWIKDTNAADGLDAAAVFSNLTAGCTYVAASSTTSKLTFTCNSASGAGLGFDFDAAAIAANTAAPGVPASTATAATVAQTLKATKYALTAKTAYTTPTGSFTTLSAVDAGEWKVDGVYVDVPYLLAGKVGEKTFSYVVNVTNNHSQTGNVTLDVYKEDGTAIATRVAAGTVASGAIKRLSTDIKSILGTYEGRFSVKVFVEVPAGKAQVYSAYVDNETSERAIVINSTN